MIDNKKDEFEAKLTRAAGSIKTKFRHPLLKDLVNFITPPALELVREQIRLADAAAVERERSGDVGKPCTNRFTTQYGLPCWHVIRSRRRSNTGLVLDDFDKHWHFVNPVAPEIDPIFTIEEAVIRPHRDRPRGGGGIGMCLSLMRSSRIPSLTTRQRDMSLLTGNLRHQPGVVGGTKGGQQTEEAQHEAQREEEEGIQLQEAVSLIQIRHRQEVWKA